MKFKIDNKIFEKFPDLNIGVVVGKGIDNKEINKEVMDLIREKEEEIRKNFNKEKLSQNPKIEVWRKAYSSFGSKPKKYKSSVENLYRIILDNIDIKHINKLVDIYNYISIKHMLPAGGEDIDKIQGDVILTFAESNEPEVLLLGDKELRSPHEGEIIYKDDISSICRRWNWREADRTKFDEATKNCILVIEGLFPITKKEVETALKEIKEIIEKYCGGEINIFILNKNNSMMEFEK